MVEKFSKDLHEAYKIMRIKPQQEEWPPYQPTAIVNVTVIHYKNHKREGLIKISKHLKSGASGISELVSSPPSHSTVTKDIIEIFKVDAADQINSNNNENEPPKRILIEGAPGIGKTVLAKEIAYLWAEHKLLTDCKLVILVYLRDPNVCTMKSVKELIQLYTSSSKVATEVNDYLENSNGKNVAFVFDGFDEFPTSQKSSIVTDIIGTSSNYVRKFCKSIVVVTSRPAATLSLHKVVNRRIEILGLDPEERDKLISQFHDKTPELEKYFKQHPIINSVCYIPLNLAILLYLFCQKNLPETLTEMNESFVIHTVYRHMEKSKFPKPDCIKHLNDIPQKLLEIIWKLAELAFNGLQNNQLVFPYDKLKDVCPEVCDVPEATDGFGLLQTVEHYPQKGAGTTTTYNFLHLTMQEYLAAYYVSTLPEEKQLELLQKSFWDENLKFMWLMYVGIVGVKCESFSSFIRMKSTHQISVTCNNTNHSIDIFRQIRNMRYLHLFQCYMEAKTATEMPKEVSTIFSNANINFTDITLLPHHVTSLLIFMFAYSTQQWKSFVLNKCNLQRIEIDNILLSINNNIERMSTLECIDLSENSYSPWGVYCTIIRHSCVKSLTLCGEEGMDDHIQEIIDSLQANTTIQSLTLHSIGKIGVESIKTILMNKLTLKLLKVSWQTNIYFNHVEKTLIHMHLSGDTNDAIQAKATNQIVNINASYDIDINYRFLPFMSTGNDTPETIYLSGENVNDNAVHVLVFGLCNSTTVKELNLSNNNITDEGAVAIIDCLKHNKTLEIIVLSYNRISLDGMNNMVKSIESQGLLSLQYVDLSNSGSSSQLGMRHRHYDSPSPWGVYSAVIRHCCSNSLTLCGDKGMNEYIKDITKSLQENKTLHSLTVFNIGAIGVQSIKEVLISNSTLKTLNLSMDKIDVEAAKMYMLLHKFLPFHNDNVTQTIKTPHGLRGVVNVSILYDIDDNIKASFVVFSGDVNTQNPGLKSISFSDRNIFNDGMHLLAFGLCNNTPFLEELNISDNMISDDGVIAIIDILKYNKTLKKIDISENLISFHGMDKMIAYIEEQGNTVSLEYVDLSKNSASPWGVYCAIIRHGHVNNLTLCGDEDIYRYIFQQEIMKSLYENATLQSLTMCNIDDRIYKRFQYILNYESQMEKTELTDYYRKLRCYSSCFNNDKITLVITINENDRDHLPSANNQSSNENDAHGSTYMYWFLHAQ